jgi:PQQ-dependent catabolism-associated CXXCW motif protein
MKILRQGLLILLLAHGGWPAAAVAEATAVAEPDGYRAPPYRAPLPATLLGAPALTTAAALDLHRAGGAIFIDVLPHDARPADLPAETIWRDRPHLSIPGAIWLANTGYEALAPQTEDGFRAALADLAAEHTDLPLVFFCKRACWMSWNAAKRAIEYGHDNVLWFPDGQDGWAESGETLAPVSPWLGTD